MTATLAIRPWPDPVIDTLGHDPRSLYVERFWLPTLGPTSLLLLRRIAAGLDEHPDGIAARPRRAVAGARPRSPRGQLVAGRAQPRPADAVRPRVRRCARAATRSGARAAGEPSSRRSAAGAAAGRAPGLGRARASPSRRSRARAAGPGGSRSRCSSRATTSITSSGCCTTSASTRRSAARARRGPTTATAHAFDGSRSRPAYDPRRLDPGEGDVLSPPCRRGSVTLTRPSPHCALVSVRDRVARATETRTETSRGRRVRRSRYARPMADDDALDTIADVAARRRRDRDPHRRGDLHRVRHPRLPRAAGRVDEEPGGREDRDPAALRGRPRGPASRVAEPAAQRDLGTRSRTPGTARSRSSSRRRRVHTLVTQNIDGLHLAAGIVARADGRDPRHRARGEVPACDWRGPDGRDAGAGARPARRTRRASSAAGC